MNEVKPTSITSIPAGSASAQTSDGKEKTVMPSGKQLPPAEASGVSQVSAHVAEVNAEQQNRLEQAISKLNEYVQSTQRDLQFSFDEAADRPVVTVLDRETQQVIRKIPDDVVLNLARKLNDEEPLRLFSAQA